jgi:hypothetical protein
MGTASGTVEHTVHRQLVSTISKLLVSTQRIIIHTNVGLSSNRSRVDLEQLVVMEDLSIENICDNAICTTFKEQQS